MTAISDASARQHQAARPGLSTWLSANAGSGKTRVLTDRVARLLIAGVDPQNILCLTYTKAAAAEMQNRLFSRLGGWAMLPDRDLRDALSEIGIEDAPPLSDARTLFARALETPGGLKIQTIHSFCASILRKFPLEAGVPPDFTEIDERAAADLISEVLDLLAESHPDAFDATALHFSGASMSDLAKEIVHRRDAFPGGLDEAAVYQTFRLPYPSNVETARQSAYRSADRPALAKTLTEMGGMTATTSKVAADVSRYLDQPSDAVLFDAVVAAVLRKEDGEPKTSILSAKRRDELGGLAQIFDDFAAAIARSREQITAISAAQKTMALHAFADVFLPAYDSAKAQRGWLDFDDLIRRTRDLLRKSEAAAWVLYRLDGGIDHILVDEAQDTSPGQWGVIAALAEEMAAGEGSVHSGQRTLFVVGDKKQSIYSFQGADPDAFDRMFDHFARNVTDASGFARLQLEYSFRSSQAILSAVDSTYGLAVGDAADGFQHRAFHQDLPGRVDLWPAVLPAEIERPEHWYDPVDLPGANHHSVVLANEIAAFILHAINHETLPLTDGTRRPIHAGDFLILVQGRNQLFHNIIRACKSKGLEVAGADRLKLTAELAVKDILSVLRFLALPEDDLALAEALRSPFLGWTERDLYALAQGRSGHLWEVLRASREEHPETLNILDKLRNRADFDRPYELIEALLTVHEGRRNLIARLGAEVEDGLDELLNQALKYEQNETPSLTGFLAWQARGDVQVKRQAEAAGRLIRVMTVHGAKGLEAPIVVLPDTLRPDKRRKGELVVTDDTLALWKTPRAHEPDALKAANTRSEAADQAERKRLLYVAMTRAEKWLIVCGGGQRPKQGGTWYDYVEQGLLDAGAVPLATPMGDGLRLSHGDWDSGNLTSPKKGQQTPIPDARWITSGVQTPIRVAAPINPSNLGGSKALPGDAADPDADAAMERGTHVHLLLEHLPNHDRSQWTELAKTLLADARDAGAVLAEATAVLSSPNLAHVFAPTSLAEVPIVARIQELGGKEMNGTIDRLVVESDRILAVDFKSNRVVPDRAASVPSGLLRQMGAYAAALSQIYPDRSVETAILWTATADLMPLPHDIVMDALQDTATS